MNVILRLLIYKWIITCCVQGLCVNVSQTSMCYDVVGNTAFTTSTCERDLDIALLTDSQYLSLLSSSCRVAVLQYRCASVFRSCTSPASLPCNAVCTNIVTSCSSVNDQTMLGVMQAALSTTFTQCGACTNEGGSGLVRVLGTPTRPKYPRCEQYNAGGVCAGFINTPIYMDANVLQSEREAVAAKSLATISFLPHNFHDSSKSCRDQFVKFTCGSLFPECDTEVYSRAINQALPVPFPRLTCKNECSQLETKCGAEVFELFKQGGLDCDGESSPLATCSGTEVVPSMAHFPVAISVFGVVSPAPSGYTGVLMTTCDAVSGRNDTSTIENMIACPSPLVTPTNPLDVPPNRLVGSCGVGCARASVPRNYRILRDQVCFIILIVALVLTTFIVATAIAFPSTRHRLFTIYGALALCLTIVQLWPYVVQIRHPPSVPHRQLGAFHCKDNAQPVPPGDVMCMMQGAIFLGLLTALCGYWALIAFDIFSKISSSVPKIAAKVMEVLIWIVAIVSCTVGLATNNFVSSEATTSFCVARTTWFSDTFYYAPMYLWCTVGGASLVGIAVIGTRVSMKTYHHKVRSGHLHHRTNFCNRFCGSTSRYARIYVWLLMMSMVWVVSILMHVYGDRTHFENYVGRRIECATSGISEDDCPASITPWVLWAEYMTTLSGIIAFILHFRLKYLRLWVYAISTCTWSYVGESTFRQDSSYHRRSDHSTTKSQTKNKRNTRILPAVYLESRSSSADQPHPPRIHLETHVDLPTIPVDSVTSTSNTTNDESVASTNNNDEVSTSPPPPRIVVEMCRTSN